MKTITLIFGLMSLCGCMSSLPKEQIINDADNNLKITEIKQKMQSDEVKFDSEHNKEYLACLDKISKLRQINKKNITKSDINDLSIIYPGYYDEAGFRIVKYHGGIRDEDIRCYRSSELSESEYIAKFESYCEDKYLHENGLLSVVLLPLRLTNVVLSIGTLGIFPLIHGPIYADYKNCTSLSKNISFNNNDKTDLFTEEEMNQLKNKIANYCQTNYWDEQKLLCDSYASLKKGCLKNFNGYTVADFGDRKEGVVVNKYYWFGGASGEHFIYDTNKYYDGQDFDTKGYWYSYVGIYDGTIQKLPAFKRTNQKISTSNEWCQYVKPKDD